MIAMSKTTHMLAKSLHFLISTSTVCPNKSYISLYNFSSFSTVVDEYLKYYLPSDAFNLQCEYQKVAPAKKLFCNILTCAKCISLKFCQFVATVYLHRLTILVDLS